MSSKELTQYAVYAAPIFAWLGILALRPELRLSLLNGARCLERYPAIWKIPFIFSFCYSLFNLIAEALIMLRTQHFVLSAHLASNWAFPAPLQALRVGDLPAAEALADVLNCLVATFPVSALAALLFLVNFRGYSGELFRALVSRFGRLAGRGLFLALAICALAAITKPVLMLALPEAAAIFQPWNLLRAGTAINALSFVFEYLLGVCFQVYLLLMAYAWVRGMQFDNVRLMHFAIRRLGFVMKWAIVLIVATLLLVHLPLLVQTFLSEDILNWKAQAFVTSYSRPFLAVTMIALFSVQITLVFHNENLLEAIGNHFAFLQTNAVTSILFIFQAYILLWVWNAVNVCVGIALHSANIYYWAWQLVQPLGSSLIGGVLLAAWVCLYKSRQENQRDVVF